MTASAAENAITNGPPVFFGLLDMRYYPYVLIIGVKILLVKLNRNSNLSINNEMKKQA